VYLDSVLPSDGDCHGRFGRTLFVIVVSIEDTRESVRGLQTLVNTKFDNVGPTVPTVLVKLHVCLSSWYHTTVCTMPWNREFLFYSMLCWNREGAVCTYCII
jgi:hypothetical protein